MNDPVIDAPTVSSLTIRLVYSLDWVKGCRVVSQVTRCPQRMSSVRDCDCVRNPLHSRDHVHNFQLQSDLWRSPKLVRWSMLSDPGYFRRQVGRLQFERPVPQG